MTIEAAKYIIALDIAISCMLSILKKTDDRSIEDGVDQLKKLKLDIYNRQKQAGDGR
ncbi:hypothetical protein SAMN05216357_110107 [Porphyromonadaceae bacterium KH3CP3RA]|nr:hypothetical protein SAMN05216357_110107 [Porphyromonadaceae bacterium KH3CP3RA]